METIEKRTKAAAARMAIIFVSLIEQKRKDTSPGLAKRAKGRHRGKPTEEMELTG